MKRKLLWIEDETESGMVERKTLLELSDEFELNIARNASDAEVNIISDHFDIYLFDIRLPPGDKEVWESIYYKVGEKLGLILLEKYFSEIKAKNGKIGICTIERWLDIEKKIMAIDKEFDCITNFKHKPDIEFPDQFETFLLNLK